METSEEFLELLTESDKKYINKQHIGSEYDLEGNKIMDEETKNWTSLDLYYKGFHIKKSWGENISRVTLMAEIDGLIQAGFKPSWNEDTNKTSVPPQSSPQATTQPPTQYKGLSVEETITKYGLTDMVALQMRTPCKRCGSVSAYNPKTGKVFCKAKCWIK